jgi:hypothetical protein
MQGTEDEPPGDAAQAFEGLRGEVSVLRRAVEALPAAWKTNQAPDYAPSLGAIAKGLAEVTGRLGRIEQHPALQMTPDQHQYAMSHAGEQVMRGAASRLDEATQTTYRHGQELARLIRAMREKRKQLEYLLWTGGAALLVGLLISPLLARVLPFGLDSRMAAFILKADDRWHAGTALLAAGSPAAWRDLEAAGELLQPNITALAACRDAAAKTNKEQRCTVVVAAPGVPKS